MKIEIRNVTKEFESYGGAGAGSTGSGKTFRAVDDVSFADAKIQKGFLAAFGILIAAVWLSMLSVLTVKEFQKEN